MFVSDTIRNRRHHKNKKTISYFSNYSFLVLPRFITPSEMIISHNFTSIQSDSAVSSYARNRKLYERIAAFWQSWNAHAVKSNAFPHYFARVFSYNFPSSPRISSNSQILRILRTSVEESASETRISAYKTYHAIVCKRLLAALIDKECGKCTFVETNRILISINLKFQKKENFSYQSWRSNAK